MRTARAAGHPDMTQIARNSADEWTPRARQTVSIGKKRVVDQDEVAHPLCSNPTRLGSQLEDRLPR